MQFAQRTWQLVGPANHSPEQTPAMAKTLRSHGEKAQLSPPYEYITSHQTSERLSSAPHRTWVLARTAFSVVDVVANQEE